ncbi:MAG: SEC-C domain-containing protein, partial [Spirochaetia bacterium]|nr:SEC-C domain-containing protein [Spirochaetia bacterium]
YAQKNPLLEYKLDVFDIFDSMLQEIKQYIARTAIGVQIQKKGTARYSAPVQKVSEVHNDVMQFGQSKTQSASAAAASPAQAQIKRTYPKVGRNDPCPCGSGKKYKHCHGASSQQ